MRFIWTKTQLVDTSGRRFFGLLSLNQQKHSLRLLRPRRRRSISRSLWSVSLTEAMRRRRLSAVQTSNEGAASWNQSEFLLSDRVKRGKKCSTLWQKRPGMRAILSRVWLIRKLGENQQNFRVCFIYQQPLLWINQRLCRIYTGKKGIRSEVMM